MVIAVSALCFLVFLVLAVWGYKRPGFHCALVLSFWVLEQVFAYRFPSVYMSNTKLVDLVIGSIVLSGVIYNRRLNFTKLPIELWLSGAVFLHAALTIPFTPNPTQSWEIYIKVLPLTILACFLAPMCIRRVEDIRDLINGVLYVAVPACIVFALGERHGRSLALDTGRELMELQPLASAQLAGYMVIFSAYRLMLPTTYRWRTPLYLVIILLGLYVIASSSSRGQMLAVFPVLLAWLPISISRHLPLNLLLATLFTGILALATYFIIDQFEFGERWQVRYIEAGTEFRLDKSEKLLSEYTRSDLRTLIFGFGSSASYSIINAYCHVVPVEVLCELGLLGALLYLTVFWRVFVFGARGVFAEHRQLLRIGIASLYGIALYDVILSLKQGSVLSGYTFACVNIVAMSLIAARNQRVRPSPAPSSTAHSIVRLQSASRF